MRVVNGFCIAGLTTAVESWLNERSGNDMRGRVLGLYMVANYLAIASGQTMVNLADVGQPDLFMLAAALIVLSLVPVAMTKLGEPKLGVHRTLGVMELHAASPVGVVGAGVAGLLVGTFYALGVVFARRIGLGVTEAAFFMSVVVMGGLMFQLPIGVLADRYDRRVVLAVALLGVGAFWGLLAGSLAAELPRAALFCLAWAFGGAISTVYPICVAQTFDRLERQHYVAASGRLLMIYSIGATAGPLLASVLMSAFGPRSFFAFESVVAVSFAVFVLIRVRRRPPLPADRQEVFVPIPDLTPLAAHLDPRTPPGHARPRTFSGGKTRTSRAGCGGGRYDRPVGGRT